MHIFIFIFEDDNSSRAAGERALRAALAAERQARSEITQLRQQNEQLTAKYVKY